MGHAPLFVVAAGTAVGLSSFASAQRSAGLERRALTDVRVAADHVESNVVERGGPMFPPGSVVTMRDELENFPLDTSFGGSGVAGAPTTFSGPPGFEWGLNTVRGQSSINFVRLVDLSGAPVGGANGVVNASRALRIRTGIAQPVNGFFTGASSTWPRALEPIAGANARVSAEHWLSGIDSLYTFEPVSTIFGFITGRVMWGGSCVENTPGDCTGIGLPVGPIEHFMVYGFTAGFEGPFLPARYCEDTGGNAIAGCVPHAGFMVGDPVPPPVQSWWRMAFETTADGRTFLFLDLLDGSPEAAISSGPILTTDLVNRLAWNASYESAGAFMLVDNIEAAGPLYEPPTPPPLSCPYVDDIDWLAPGPVLGQTSRWFAALSSALRVIDDGSGNRFLRQVNNVSFDNTFREEFRTDLPTTYALPGDPWTLCLDAATTGSGGNATARAFAIDSEATNFVAGAVTARVFLGRTDPLTGFVEPTIYVQSNIEYDPNDDPLAQDPLAERAPMVGVDIVSTGVDWPADGQFHALCVAVANDNAMTVSLDGVEIYSGVAFSNGASTLRVESENNALGAGARLDVDNLSFDCDALPLVSLPALAAPYLDDFNWGVDNVPPRRHIDDAANSPLLSTRYTNVNGVVMRKGAVAMANVFRDMTQAAPPDPNGAHPIASSQFTSATPSIAVDDATGWRVDATLSLSDFLTSRGVSPAQRADVGSELEIGGYLWICAVDQKVYLFGSPDNAAPGDDLAVIDTGFTLTALGVVAGSPFAARVEFNRATGRIDWTVNGAMVGSTNPIVGTDDLGAPRVHRNLDAVVFWGGDDDAAPATPPYSTLTVDDLRARAITPCADANGDNVVNFADLNAILSAFGQTGPIGTLPGDVNADGAVNFGDLNAVLSAFGTACD